MKKYIPLDALLAWAKKTYLCENASAIRKVCYKQLVEHLNVLEVKEVDLEKEYEEYVEEDPVYNKLVNGIVGKAIAKHFFELGLNASNPLTWEDIEMIGKLRLKVALDLRNKELESSINNPIKFTEEDLCKEVLKRFKAQKGE